MRGLAAGMNSIELFPRAAVCSWCVHAYSTHSWRRRHLASTAATHGLTNKTRAGPRSRVGDDRRTGVERVGNHVRPPGAGRVSYSCRRTPAGVPSSTCAQLSQRPAGRRRGHGSIYHRYPTSSSALARATWRHLDRGLGRESSGPAFANFAHPSRGFALRACTPVRSVTLQPRTQACLMFPNYSHPTYLYGDIYVRTTDMLDGVRCILSRGADTHDSFLLARMVPGG
jgi:hypothetical protein